MPASEGATWIVTCCPPAVIEPEESARFNQEAELPMLVCTLSGHAQLPEAVIVTGCGPGSALPRTALNASAPDEGCASMHGGCTRRLTMIVCGLPAYWHSPRQEHWRSTQ